jgi:hypothetical protein
MERPATTQGCISRCSNSGKRVPHVSNADVGTMQIQSSMWLIKGLLVDHRSAVCMYVWVACMRT